MTFFTVIKIPETLKLSSLRIADPSPNSTPNDEESEALVNTTESFLTLENTLQSISSNDEIIDSTSLPGMTPLPKMLSKQKEFESSQQPSTSTGGFTTNTAIHSTPAEISGKFPLNYLICMKVV